MTYGSMNIEIFCDGSGLGGWGFTATSSSGNVLYEEYGKLDGDVTNNILEYRAVIEALKWVRDKTCGSVSIFTDSMLVVSQVSGTWRCKKPHLQPLLKEAKTLVFETRAKLAWIPRGKNTRADELSHGWQNESK